jgi:F-type H+-transporting ATPase subunit a
LFLVVGGAWLAHGGLSATEPSARQNVGEWILQFFVGKAREMAHGEKRDQIMRLVSSLLATAFLFIIVCNSIAMLPIPILNRPPTSHFSVTLALALCAVMGTLIISAVIKGVGKTILHLFWPNPLQWVSEITDVMSLSLRLFGNIAGEYMTVALVVMVVPWGIPFILHVLGLIPTFVQALVFTLLTSSFIANAIHVADTESAPAESTEEVALPAAVAGRMPAEGRS